MDRDKENNKFSFRVIWSAFMSLVYLVLAYLIAFTPIIFPYNFRQGDTETDDFLIPRVVLAIGLLLYGLYRGYNVIKSKK